jgi:hypothetical protein
MCWTGWRERSCDGRQKWRNFVVMLGCFRDNPLTPPGVSRITRARLLFELTGTGNYQIASVIISRERRRSATWFKGCLPANVI